jgi:hypothetical protein
MKRTKTKKTATKYLPRCRRVFCVAVSPETAVQTKKSLLTFCNNFQHDLVVLSFPVDDNFTGSQFAGIKLPNFETPFVLNYFDTKTVSHPH